MPQNRNRKRDRFVAIFFRMNLLFLNPRPILWLTMGDFTRYSRYLETAAEQYGKVVFKTEALFNDPAPEPRVAFIIGIVLSFIGFFMWLRRVQIFKKKMENRKVAVERHVLLSTCISCAIDSDDAFYTIVSFGAASFLFLGGLQLHFAWTLLAMLLTYTASAVAETIRILLAFHYTPSLKALVVTSDIVASQMRSIKTDLNPSNVYEDLGRGKTIVLMVFITQIILISFVCMDMYQNETNNCLDGSKDCPVVGTFGSWCFYVLGIFMACVFQLGPRTKFGESEQNPAYWLQLLLTTKEVGAKVTWYDPVKDRTSERQLSSGDGRIWIRFFMSFLINGVGYHILVHALPIQVAQQGTLTGVVIRAVGMMYLVDMDDTPGYKLTVVLKHPETIEKKTDVPKTDEPPKEETTKVEKTAPPPKSNEELNKAAQEIIEEAKKKLDALMHGEPPITLKGSAQTLFMGALPLQISKNQENENTTDILVIPSGDDQIAAVYNTTPDMLIVPSGDIDQYADDGSVTSA